MDGWPRDENRDTGLTPITKHPRESDLWDRIHRGEARGWPRFASFLPDKRGPPSRTCSRFFTLRKPAIRR